MMRWFVIMLTTWMTGVLAAPLRADIYLYIDAKGVYRFTNVPTSDKYRLYVKEQPRKAFRTLNRFPAQFDPYIRQAAERYGVSVPLIKAIIKAESDFNPLAVSKKGAKGLMQIMPENFKALNIRNPFDPAENIMGGARYVKNLLKRYEGRLPLTLAAYNAGPTVVDQYQEIPPYEETRNYVRKVLRYYDAFQ